jgi:hypothetical protein
LISRTKLTFEYAGAAGGYIDKYGYPYCRGRMFDTVEKILVNMIPIAKFFGPRVLVSLLEVVFTKN